MYFVYIYKKKIYCVKFSCLKHFRPKKYFFKNSMLFWQLHCRSVKFNPILTGGWVPPVWNPWPPQIATRLFMSFFFQVLRIFWYQVCENRTIGRKVTWRFVLARRHKICPKSAFCIYVFVQNTWKLLIFLKCSKTVFILSFWPFAQFLISWN